MKKIIKVNLSVNGIKDLTAKLRNFQQGIKEAQEQIVEDLIDIAKTEIEKGYASSPYEGYEESFSIGKTKNKAYVSGSQVIYREFGTGTAGAQESHPEKNNPEFGLKPYNSGETIRPAKITIPPETGILPRRFVLDFL